jgi:hypothetical protein
VEMEYNEREGTSDKKTDKIITNSEGVESVS